MSLPFCRSYMFVSTSRTIGKKISPGVSSKSGIGPTLIIWWTAGVSGIAAPAMLRDARAPDAAADEDVLRLDRALVGVHAPDAPVLDVDARHLGARGDRQRAERRRGLAHQRAGAERVDAADAGRVEAAEDDLLVDVRHELLHLRRRQQLRRLAPRDRRGDAPVELLQPLLRPRDLDPAADRVHAELDVLVRRVPRERGHLLRVVDGEDEVGGVPGRAAGVRQRALVEQHEVAPAEPREVVNHAVADDAGADDDRLRARGEVRHRPRDPTSCSSCRSSPSVPTSRISSRRPMISAACSAWTSSSGVGSWASQSTRV